MNKSRNPYLSPLGKIVRGLLLLLLPLLLLASCKDSDESPDSYPDWQARNAQWFAEIYDAAQAEIAAAKAQYPNGNEWEQNCDWRIYRTLLKSQETEGPTTDYIVCKINERGDGEWSPAYTDSVRLHYRGWIMDENYPQSKTNLTVFTQTYYGEFDTKTAAPLAMPVINNIEGFQTALQYMVKGDEWDVYIPQELAYKETESESVPAYSTLLYRIRVERVHKSGTGMSGWR